MRFTVRLLLVAVLALAGATAAACSRSALLAPSSLSITAQPRSQTIAQGAPATLTVAASGSGAMRYQWFAGISGDTRAPVVSATGPSLTMPPLADTSDFWVRVTDVSASVDSITATITVEAASGVPPVITTQPEDDVVRPGDRARIDVGAKGDGPLSYQWYVGPSGETSVPVVDAIGTDYTTPGLDETTRFWVRVSNAAGTVDSRTATIVVSEEPSVPSPEPPEGVPPLPDPAPDPPAPAPDPPPAAPPPPSPEPSVVFENEVLSLVNAHRAAGATCGGTPYPAVAPLSVDTALRPAARAHSADMAANDYVSHTSQDGTAFSDRIWNAGYTGRFPLGENIAAGQSSPATVVSGWMSSTGHCKNIMNGGFTDAGIGYAYLAGSTYRHYWTMDFGGG